MTSSRYATSHVCQVVAGDSVKYTKMASMHKKSRLRQCGCSCQVVANSGFTVLPMCKLCMYINYIITYRFGYQSTIQNARWKLEYWLTCLTLGCEENVSIFIKPIMCWQIALAKNNLHRSPYLQTFSMATAGVRWEDSSVWHLVMMLDIFCG